MLNKVSIHVFVRSSEKYMWSVLKHSFLCSPAISYDILVTQQLSRDEHLKRSWYIFNLSFALYIALMRFVHIFAYIRSNIEPQNLERLSFVDDVTLLALFPTFLKVFMNICHKYSVTWRYEFNHLKSGVITFGEAKSVHSRLLTDRDWLLGETTVNELFEYKNLGVLKNFIASFSSNVEDNIEKTRKEAGTIFSSDFDRRKTNPLVYIKFWRQACLPCLLFGTKILSLNASQLGKLERCQQWFLKNVFHVPRFAAGKLLLRLANLNSTESEIDLKSFSFWAG